MEVSLFRLFNCGLKEWGLLGLSSEKQQSRFIVVFVVVVVPLFCDPNAVQKCSDIHKLISELICLFIAQEVTLGDAPSLMTLVYTSSHKSLVCVGYKHQFDLISEAGDVSRIHSIDKQKVL